MTAFAFALGLAVVFAFMALVLTRSVRQGTSEVSTEEDRAEQFRRELRSYLQGIVFALALTGAAFALVYWKVAARHWIFLALGVLAFVQVAVHFRYFLHIDPPRQKVDDLHLILFTALILTMMAGGTIWILGNLALRMH